MHEGQPKALECELIVPAKWVTWDGNTNLFEQFCINMIQGGKKRFACSLLCLPGEYSPSCSLLGTTLLAPGSTLPLAGCLLVCSLISASSLSQYTCYSLSLWLPIFISLSTDSINVHRKVGPRRNPSQLCLRNLFQSEKLSLRFPLFCCWRFGFSLRFPVLGGVFCSSVLS